MALFDCGTGAVVAVRRLFFHHPLIVAGFCSLVPSLPPGGPAGDGRGWLSYCWKDSLALTPGQPPDRHAGGGGNRHFFVVCVGCPADVGSPAVSLAEPVELAPCWRVATRISRGPVGGALPAWHQQERQVSFFFVCVALCFIFPVVARAGRLALREQRETYARTVETCGRPVFG